MTPAPTFAPVPVAQWVQVGNDIDGENPGDRSGYSVALSSNGAVVAIGAIGNDGGGSDTGHVRVYVNAGGGWEQRGSDLDGSVREGVFGWSVSLSADGTILAVSSQVPPSINSISYGQVHVFQWISNAWQPLGSTLDTPRPSAFGQFGTSLALSDSGTILAMGDFLDPADFAGRVQVFAWTGTDWTQRGNDLLGSQNDGFGTSVSLSSDGSILACGANIASYVRVYSWNGSAWQQQGATLFGPYFHDGFGYSVSLSGDGSIVAVGADRYALVYRNDGSDWVQIGQSILEFRGSVSLSCPLMVGQSSLAIGSMIPTALIPVMPWSLGYHQTNKNGGK